MYPLSDELLTQFPALPEHRPYFSPLRLVEQSFDDVNMSYRSLWEVGFHKCTFHRTNLQGCELDDSGWGECHLSYCDLSDIHTYKTQFRDLHIVQSSLDRAFLWRSDFFDCTFKGSHLREAKVTALFANTEFTDTSWEGAMFNSASMQSARFHHVNFTGARITSLRLWGTTELDSIEADWILVGDDILSARLEKAEALAYLESLTIERTVPRQKWNRAPDLHPAIQQQLRTHMVTHPEQPFAGMKLNRSAIEWVIGETMRTNAEFDLRGVDLRGLDLDTLPLHYALARRWSTPCAIDASQTSCRSVDLTGAYLAGSNFTQAKLYEAIADHADFSNCNFTSAKLSNIHAEGASFAHANLAGAYLGSANPAGKHLYTSHLQGADFSYANLQGADLRGANLEGAIFEGADLTDVKWS